MSSFSEAFQAMEKGLSEQSQQTNSNSEPENNSAPDKTDAKEVTKEQPTIYDLDSFSGKIKYKGKEFDVSELEKGWLRQADYTRKTQELAEERKYYDNLIYDLESVKSNPDLVEEFKKIYPQKYHAYVDLVAAKAEKAMEQGLDPSKQALPNTQIPKDLLDKLDLVSKKVEQFEAEKNEQLVAAYEKQIDAIFESAKSKYKFFDEDKALTRAQLLSSQGVKLDEATWAKIFKSIDDEYLQRLKAYKDEQFTTQTSASKQAREGAPGGGIPAQAPNTPKTFKAAGELFEEHYKKGII
jgi:hypothetical protein